MKYFICTVLFYIAGCQIILSQLAIDNSIAPDGLVSNVLLGAGVEASNISFNGNDADILNTQFGYFSGGNNIIGLESGIILATGQAQVAVGPNTVGSAYIELPEGDALNVEPDLAQIVGPVALRDVAKLEFDFLAQGDTLRFRFVFASEEYNEYTCSSYNDAFGFFISGPGISGNPDFENAAKNIALIPGTNVPVGINTVNQGFAGVSGSNSICNATSANWEANSIYYVNNESNTDLLTTQFDGFTVPMEVKVAVQCGETYHIKIALADAVDGKNDSAVFLEAESFSSEAPVEASISILNPDADGIALEGCSAYEINITRPDTTDPKTFYLKTFGLDNPESVLSGLPESVVFEAGESSKTLAVETVNDFEFGGLRNFDFQILQTETCGLDTAIFSFPVTLTDRENLELIYSDSVLIGCNELGAFSIQPAGGNPPYSIDWSHADLDGFDISYDFTESMTLSAIVTDDCLLFQDTIEIFVFKEDYPEMGIVMPDVIEFNCLTNTSLDVQVWGGSDEKVYTWSMNGNVISNDPLLNQIIASPGTLTLSVSDQCAPTISEDIEAVLVNNPVNVNLGTDTSTTCGSSIMLLPEVSGGFGQLSYAWFRNQVLVNMGPAYDYVAQTTSTIRLKVSDQCEQEGQDDLVVYVPSVPLNVFLPSDTAVCFGDQLLLTPQISGGSAPYTYIWLPGGQQSKSLSVTVYQDMQYTLEVKDNCLASKTALTDVEVQDVHAEFEFDYEREMGPIQNHSTPDVLYSWIFPDGSHSNQYEPYFNPPAGEESAVVLTVGNEIGCSDTYISFYEPPFRIFVPNAFTPDGDGLNDIFKAEGQYVAEFKMWIFDRWGNLVFETDDMQTGWNGGDVQNNDYAVENSLFTYKYMAKSWTSQIHEGTGTITLIR